MKNELIGALVVAALFLGAAFYFSKNTNTNTNMDKTNTSPATVKIDGVAGVVSDLVSEDLVVGTGAEAVAGKKLSMHYVGTLQNGVKFDSSRDRGMPFEFTLGTGMVIKGWDQGIVGMKVGGKRKLTIPASLAYGASSVGAIPPNSTLIFEVELFGVK